MGHSFLFTVLTAWELLQVGVGPWPAPLSEPRTQKLGSSCAENPQLSKVPSLKPAVGYVIASRTVFVFPAFTAHSN